MSANAPNEQPPAANSNRSGLRDSQAMAKLDRRRRTKDRLANGMIAGGGVFVLIAILAIFVYLLSESWPLFAPSSVEKEHSFQTTSTQANASFVELDEFDLAGMRLMPNDGFVQFFDVKTGQSTGGVALEIPEGVSISSVRRGPILDGLVGVGLSNGQLIVFKPSFSSQGVDAQRTVEAALSFPFGNAPLTVSDFAQPLVNFSLRSDNSDLQVLAVVDSRLKWQRFAHADGGGLGGGVAGGLSLDAALGGDSSNASDVYERQSTEDIAVDAANISAVHVGQGGRWFYLLTRQGMVQVLNKTESGIVLYDQVRVDQDGAITTSSMLQGDISLLLGTATGHVSQWFLVRGSDQEQRMTLTKIREFDVSSAPITVIQPEARRKGFLAGDQEGNVGYFYTTSNRTVNVAKMADSPITAMTLSNHSAGMLVDSMKGSSFWEVDAEHPDVSFSSLWGKVWYESYPEPQYVWQSTSGNVDFESKMSLIPLTFGTLKAAFWAMLLAAPLAIAGAMYTAAFMSPALRTKIKPTIELMQALPTVILGFLAGLWLAPLTAKYLPAIFSLLIIVPIVILVCGFLWMQIPLEKRNRIPAGIAPVVLILPIMIAVSAAFLLSQPFEHAVFSNYGGSLVSWLRANGIDYQSQNALIIGLIMGFAVIAPIFSISEDALFAVPQHLVNGSLALGATPWQTLMTVILPTASPGIFSAVMIGFGRAVGETMIVLMATGNTPIMDLSLFNGMRTLSANVAVEMGEAEVGSTHFRVLFLSALVLFVMTFILNTAAEVVRARLRKKYGSL
jgi:phosphate transport system permease protein